MSSLVVIDDNVDTLESITDYLKLKGFDVLGCGRNGLEAVELYKKFRPDIVLLDLAMPEFDGFYGLEHIKKINSHAKVVILTGVNDEVNEKKIKVYNVTKILEKPCSLKQLEKVLKTLKMMI